MSSLLTVFLALVFVLEGLSASADILPAGRRTAWNPGIPGGVPVRTTVCANINASTYGNGTVDATAGIQAAIDACPVGQVVKLSAGDFLINGSDPITIDKGIVLRGAGPATTKLRHTNGNANPLILIGYRWPNEAASVNLTANAAKEATSVQVASTAGFSVGQLVLLDELTDDSYVYWGKDSAAAPGGPARGWFTRYDRAVGQMLEIASISGSTISFTTALHIAFDTAHTAQLTRYTVTSGVKNAGVEDLYVRGGLDGNIKFSLAMYSWVKNVESDFSTNDSIGMESSVRCVVRDSYVHDVSNPNPGGAGYLLSVGYYTSDTLVENNIFIRGNKVMVMRSTGGGNVIGYNYMDDGYIEVNQGWMESGINASHMAEAHFELFEGNQAFNADADDYWGGAVYITFFRNHLTAKRRSFTDDGFRRAVSVQWGHYYYSFVGNVLGTSNQDPAPFSGFCEEDVWPWDGDPAPMWVIGADASDWDSGPDLRTISTLHRHANFDYVTNLAPLAIGYDTTLPDSLYLTGKPAFFGTNPWPWVDATGATKLYTLPARERYDKQFDAIFDDGFESDDLSAWSASATDGGNLSASAAAAMPGPGFGLQAFVNDTAGVYVQDDSPANEDRYRARFYFDTNGFDPGEAQAHFRTRIFLAFEENPIRRLAAIVVKRQGGVYGLMGRARLDDGSQADTGFFTIADGPHLVELDWKRSSGPATNDGTFQLWIDGVSRSTLTGLDNSISSVDFVRIGAMSVKTGAFGTLFWDGFASRRQSYIGP